MQSTLEDRPIATALRIWFLTSMFFGATALALSFIAAAGFFPLALMAPAVALIGGLPALFILIPVLRWIQSLKLAIYLKIYLLRVLCMPMAILYGIAAVYNFPYLPQNLVHLAGVGATTTVCLFTQLSLTLSRHLLNEYFTDTNVRSSPSPGHQPKNHIRGRNNDSFNHIGFY